MEIKGRINEESRCTALTRLTAAPVDVLVVGGGITGAGIALDIASRGFSVGLVEQGDLGSGTSSKSSKLIHGGLRYLEQLNFKLVREALRERDLLLTTIAPHLVEPVQFLLPVRHRFWERLYLGCGTLLYDRLGGSSHLPGSKHLSRKRVRKVAAGLKSRSHVGGITFWDAQEDDARYVLTVARTAAAHGAHIATQVAVTGLNQFDGKVQGVRAIDRLSGKEIWIQAKHVVFAVGAWNADLLGQNSIAATPLSPSKGVHITLPRNAIDLELGLIARTPTGLLFAIPWEGQWLVGDTDTPWDSPPESVMAQRSDVQELLDRLNFHLNEPVHHEQITGVFAGLRPLASVGEQMDTKKLSREHHIATPVAGLTCITGGKFTTYRAMAEDLADRVVHGIAGPGAPGSKTSRLPLLGAVGFAELWAERERLAQQFRLPTEQVCRLLRRHGSSIHEVMALVGARPDLAAPLEAAPHVLRAEIVYACSHEGAFQLADVLERRTRLAIQLPDGGMAAMEETASIMAEELGWSASKRHAECEIYVSSIEAKNAMLLPPTTDR